MKRVDYELLDRFICRTPLLSAVVVTEMFDDLQNTDLSASIEGLLNRHPEIKAAIRIASSNVYERTEKWLKSGRTIDDKLLETLTKYICRMSTRPTPYGHFAGITVGHWNEKSVIQFENLGTHLYGLEVDTSTVKKISTATLIKWPWLLKHVKLYTNTGIWVQGVNYKYISYSDTVEDGICHVTNRFTRTEYLDKIMGICHEGATWDEVDHELQKSQAPEEEREDYIFKLLKGQILLSEFDIFWNEGSQYSTFCRIIGKVVSSSGDPALEMFHRGCVQIMESLYKGIDETHRAINTPEVTSVIDLERDSDLFHGSLIKTASEAKLSFKIANRIRKAVRALSCINRPKRSTDISGFIREFQERYGRRLVPILEVLDTETGIPYPASRKSHVESWLIDEVEFQSGDGNEAPISVTRLQKIILRKITENDGDCMDVFLTKEDVGKETTSNLPDTLMVTSKLFKDPSTGRESTYVVGGAFSTAIAGISRFATTSLDVESICKDIIESETGLAVEPITADLVYSPTYTRATNIMTRGADRPHEVVISGKQCNPGDTESIPISDILLGVRGGILCVWSKKRECRVRIIISNAHNHQLETNPVYHLLGDMQYQDLNWPLNVDVSTILQLNYFSPRIWYGKGKDILIKPCMWQVETKQLLKALSSEDEWLTFLKRRNIPRCIQIVEGDNLLYVDLRTDVGKSILRRYSTKQDWLLLEEYLLPSDTISDQEGRPFNNEIISMFMRKEQRKHDISIPPIFGSLEKVYLPGSSWIYFKIYCGTSTADLILDQLLKVSEGLCDEGVVERWYYVRYWDPKFHLRVRFFAPDRSVEARYKLLKIMEELWESRVIYDLLMDTYKPEWARYGPSTMRHTEILFHSDSESCVKMLQWASRKTPELKWRMFLASMNQWMDDFRLTVESRINILEWLCRNSRQIRNSKALRFKSNALREKGISTSVPEVERILVQRSAMTSAAISNLESVLSDRIKLVYVADIIHMHINRLCADRPNQHEIVLYRILLGHYKQISARSEME